MNTTPKFLVYGLVDPESGQLRYVGKSSNGIRRATEHVHPSKLKKERAHKANWIRQLLAKGLKPNIILIQECDEHEFLSQAEIFWIGYFRQLGCPLTNVTAGGEGCLGLRHTAATKALISQKLMGHPCPGTVLSNKRRKGRARTPFTAEHRANLSRARGGRPILETTTGTVFNTRGEAARFANTSAGNVGKILRGIGKRIHGFSFRYV